LNYKKINVFENTETPLVIPTRPDFQPEIALAVENRSIFNDKKNTASQNNYTHIIVQPYHIVGVLNILNHADTYFFDETKINSTMI